MLNKTQTGIMEFFVGRISKKFTIQAVSDSIKKSYPLVHRSIKPLLDKGFILKDEHSLLFLNYRENHPTLAYIESLRAEKFLQKHKIVNIFLKDMSKNIKSNIILLVFGSYIEGKESKGSDIDILAIVEDQDKVNNLETGLNAIASLFSQKFDINVISFESVYEMLSKRDEFNVMNEMLNKHIILVGAEQYYRVLKDAIK